jgi:hypothetical protein
MSEKVSTCIPNVIAKQFRMIPVENEGNVIVVATDRELDKEFREAVTFLIGCPVAFVLRPSEWIDSALDRQEIIGELPTPHGQYRYYRPKFAEVASDGTIRIRVSVYEPDMSHWSGNQTILKEDPEYQFWIWLLKEYEHSACLSQDEVFNLRGHWRGNKGVRNEWHCC